MQVQHYLGVSGFSCWYVAALIYGREFIVQKIECDEEIISYLVTIEKRFWSENILKGHAPDPDGMRKCSQMIADMYFKADKEKSVELYGFKDDLERRSELDMLIKKLEAEKEIIDQKIKLEMQDASYATADNFKVSWTSVEMHRLDTKKLKAEQPDIYERYCKNTNSRRFSVSRAA